MATRLSTMVADFTRGYTATQRILEAYLARKEHADSCERVQGLNYFNAPVFLNCHNTVNEELARLTNSGMENLGKRLYQVTHRRDWSEAMQEAGL